MKTVPQYRLEMLIEKLFCSIYSKHRRVAAIHRNPVDVIRFGGAAYLIYLAFKCFRSVPVQATAQVTSRSPMQNFQRGFLTNLLNPKAILFSGVFLPQFATPAYGPMFQQIVGLGAALACLGLLFQSALSIASGSLGQWLLSSTRRQLLLERLMGVVFVGLAARLIMMERKS